MRREYEDQHTKKRGKDHSKRLFLIGIRVYSKRQFHKSCIYLVWDNCNILPTPQDKEKGEIQEKPHLTVPFMPSLNLMIA